MTIAPSPVSWFGTNLWLINCSNTNYDSYFLKYGYTTNDQYMIKLLYAGDYEDWNPITELAEGQFYMRITTRPYVYEFSDGSINYYDQQTYNSITLVTQNMANKHLPTCSQIFHSVRSSNG